MDSHAPLPTSFETELAACLRPMMVKSAGTHRHGTNLFTYCALDRERFRSVELEDPVIGVVLQGTKEVWLGDLATTLAPGCLFVLPRKRPLDIVNVPGAGDGVYESLLLSVPELPASIPPPAPGERSAAGEAPDFRVGLTKDLFQALLHAASTIADPAAAESLKAIRLLELLTLLRPEPAARHLFHRTAADEVTWLISRSPAEAWTVGRVAQAMEIGSSTLRRRLDAEGTSFRALLKKIRFEVARRLLESGLSSFAAAEAAGYTSRSHFARRYREIHGMSPTGR
jgi:AraC-like DNA-binding protein